MVQSLKATLSSRAAVLIYAASAVRFFGGYTIAAFMPLFFKVRFYKAATKPSPSSSQLLLQTYYPDSVASYGLANALCVGIGGIISSYGGGVLADRWSATNARVRCWQPLHYILLAFPPGPILTVSLPLLRVACGSLL